MIRKAVAADLPQAAGIYEEILDREETTGPVYTNWQRGKYPTIDTAQEALDAGTLYVGEEDGRLWGVVNLNAIQLPEYDAIPWSLPAEREEVGVIHTLCIRPACSGRGYARQMVAFCMRLDTWEGNLPANRLYPSLGYRYAGQAEFFFMGFVRENLNCYEKALCGPCGAGDPRSC